MQPILALNSEARLPLPKIGDCLRWRLKASTTTSGQKCPDLANGFTKTSELALVANGIGESLRPLKFLGGRVW